MAPRYSLLALACLLLGVGGSVAVADGSPGLTARRLPRADRRQAGSQTCKGTLEAPGVLAGSYSGDVSIQGVCYVDEQPATVSGNLTVLPGSAVVALHTGEPSLTVTGDVLVEKGASALLGCDPGGLRCLNAEEGLGSVLIENALKAKKPLGVVMHDSLVRGSVTETGGGGGLKCEYPGVGIFGTIGFPVYSDYESSTIDGSLKVSHVVSCWLGVNRNVIGGSVSIVADKGEPDAVEILDNDIAHNLTCKKNSRVWDSEETAETLYPREPRPNTVGGTRSGECVLSSPATEGGQLGPGPF